MKAVTLVFLIFLHISHGLFNFQILNHLPPLESNEFTTASIDFGLDSDEIWYQTNQFLQTSKFKTEFELKEECNEKVLKVISSDTIGEIEVAKDLYVKDPCLSILVILKEDQSPDLLLKNPVQNQPFIFAMQPYSNGSFESWQLFEIQFYCKKIIHLSTWNQNVMHHSLNTSLEERRSDFNGSILRFVKSHDFNYDAKEAMEVLSMIQDKFNLKLSESNFEGYGLKHLNGTWTGAVQQIIDNEIDVATLKATLTNERLQFVQPGYVINKEFIVAVYNKQLVKGLLAWNSILTAFHELVYLLMAAIMFMLSFLLSYEMNRCFPRKFFMAMMSSTKSLFSQSFDEDQFNFAQHKWSKRLQVFSISLLGAFLFWCFSGVLTSLLAIPSSNVPLKSLDDLNSRSDLKIIVKKSSGFILSYIYKWSRSNVQSQKVLNERIIVAQDWNEIIKEMHANTNTIVLFPNLGLSTLFQEFRRQGLNERDFGIEQLSEFGTSSVGWMYPKNSILKPLFDEIFLQLEEKGIKQREYQQSPSGEVQSSQLIKVDLGFTTLIFAILFCGTVLALVLFIAELLWNHCSSSKFQQEMKIV